MILKMAVRNLSRNKRTNLVIGIIMCVGLIFVVISSSFIEGIKTNYEKLILGTIAGDISISTKEELFQYSEKKLDALGKLDGVLEAAPRLYSSCYLFRGDAFATATCIGIDELKDEQLVSNFSRKEKKFKLQPNSIAITKQQAETIGVNEGDTVQIVFFTANGQSEKKDVTVSYIYEGKSSNSAIEAWVVMKIADMSRLMKTEENTVSVIKVFSENGVSLPGLKKQIIKILNNDTQSFTAETWQETAAADMMRTPNIYSAILMVFAGILFVLIAIGITSVLFSALLGRIREFGVMQTLGMRRSQVVLMNLIEMLILISISMAAGTVICIAAVGALNAAEIGIASDALKFTFGGSVLVLKLKVLNCLFLASFIYILSICISVIAARKVTKIPILDAMND